MRECGTSIIPSECSESRDDETAWEASASRGRVHFRIPVSPHPRYCFSNTCVYPFTTSVSTLFVTDPWYRSPVSLDSKSSEPLSFV